MQNVLSVIVTSYNEGLKLQLTTDSILTSNLRELGSDLDLKGLEVIVVDDCSTDNSTDYLKALTDPRITLLVNNERLGVANSRNNGASIATGDVICFMDAHMSVERDTLCRMYEYARTYPTSIIAPILRDTSDANNTNLVKCDWSFREGMIKAEWGANKIDSELISTPCFTGPGWMITKYAYDRYLGEWPKCLTQWGSTEVYRCLQAYRKNIPIYIASNSIMTHVFRKSFPYTVDKDKVWANAYIVAKSVFGADCDSLILSEMKRAYTSPYIESILRSDKLDSYMEFNSKDSKYTCKDFIDTYFNGKLTFKSSSCKKCGSKEGVSRALPLRPAISGITADTPELPCILCALKHVGKAHALLAEVVQGYPHNRWKLVGELALASDHMVGIDTGLADTLRNLRHQVDIDSLPDKGSVDLVLKTMHELAVKLRAEQIAKK